ncbi:MAG: terminase large subunit [Clostridiales bacterium]|uniref:terminase TerL endonuclease subunit n=1 Tax=Terrisporobacter sp. TaxID=1965305 RepID=UPI002A5282E1|nr:terminase TerL endonuclease subunit [Terrisporobacter sp.]MDD7753574.1 terminase large subunit [Clostridiales bacterium]MDY4134432.1 terminase TerL endonuclease subunit [Terrisporobacter sp.]
MLMITNYDELIGYRWAKDVVEGKFVANKWVKLECQKYIDRLENLQHKDDFQYYCSKKEKDIIYGLLHFINFGTGFYAGKSFIEYATGYQMFVIENIFLWLNKDSSIKQRMIEEVYLQLGRKSSKSVLCSIIEILIMLKSSQFSQNAICGLTRDITSLIKADMEKILRNSPRIGKYFKIQRDKIICTINDSTCRNLSGDANNGNGLLLQTFIFDECGSLPDQELIGVMKLSQMSTENRLAIYISTSYDMEISAWFEMIDWYKKVLDGAIEDNGKTMGLIFELDEGDDYSDESCWIKASPLQMTLENGREFLRSEFQKAIEIPSKMREFRIKILNERLPSAKVESYIPISDIKECVIPKDEFSFRGKNVYVGVDASMTSDNTSVTMVCLDNGKIYVKSMCFIPEGRIMEKSVKEKCDYRRFIQEGDCIACGDLTINYSVLEDYVANIEKSFGCKVMGIAYDRWNFISSATKLEAQGLKMIDTPMHSKVLSPIYKLLEEKVLNKEICFLDNGLLLDNFANCRCKYSENMDKYLTKKSSNGKIDMVISLALALTQLEERELRYKRKQFISYDL